MEFGTTTHDCALAVCSLAGCHFQLRRKVQSISFSGLDQGGGIGMVKWKEGMMEGRGRMLTTYHEHGVASSWTLLAAFGTSSFSRLLIIRKSVTSFDNCGLVRLVGCISFLEMTRSFIHPHTRA